ncbi:NAD-dependent epimerase/dehydratase family protein [Janibacter cremeus]|uniref:dTDP-4-dehydrorhamnose reductase n=1 Tax=Janibacter cremeus TaxID=1285192 RepID=A0A852VUA2_9MICO|nr:dTDP-4-dehydrorhamnose reductase [Janibacter cremeus]
MSGVAVVGATGFVGDAVVERLRTRGVVAKSVRAPRISGTVGAPAPTEQEVDAVAAEIAPCTAVINAAGVADSLAGGIEHLDGANGLLPGLLARACNRLGVRLVHISSAAVQGRRPGLDSTLEYQPFSAYSRSKVMGEQAVLAVGDNVCVYRPPGVHARGRAVTCAVARLASSPLRSVASPGTDNAPQALLENVADAAVTLALYSGVVPRVVHHPAEGITTSGLLTALGSKPPHVVPRAAAQLVVAAAQNACRCSTGLAGQARRLEVLWLGQEQAHSWLTDIGWKPPVGTGGWGRMTIATNMDLEDA